MKPFPKKPTDHNIPNNLVYVGKIKDGLVQDFGEDLYYKEDLYYVFGYRGNSPSSNYAIEFGSKEWNRWAELTYKLFEIPEDYVWIGTKPIDRFGLKPFKGASCGFLSPGVGVWCKYRSCTGSTRDQYIIHKDDPSYEKAKQHFCQTKPVINSEETLDESDIRLIKDYRKAVEELKEAKDKGWKICYRSDIGVSDPRPIDDRDTIVIKNNRIELKHNTGFVYNIWSDYTIIKEEPVPKFSITTNEGTYYPVYFDTFWKFGCAEISHETIKGIITTYDKIDQDNTNLFKNITKVTIGKGTFSIEQLKELNNYHTKKK